MKTAVLMERKLFNGIIHQNHKTEYLSATDLIKVGNIYRTNNGLAPFDYTRWLATQSVKEFITELEKEVGKSVWKPARGRGHHTWCHPYLFIDLALAINPKLKIEVYKWLFDYLLERRNDSGDSYKLMAGSLYVHHGNKATFGEYMKKVAKQVRWACGVDEEDSNVWQTVDESILRQRDLTHNNIALLADVIRNNDEAVRLGILRTRTELTKEARQE